MKIHKKLRATNHYTFSGEKPRASKPRRKSFGRFAPLLLALGCASQVPQQVVVRNNDTSVFSGHGTTTTLKAAIPLLSHEDSRVRSAAAKILGSITFSGRVGIAQARNALETAFCDPDIDVQIEVRIALTQLSAMAEDRAVQLSTRSCGASENNIGGISLSDIIAADTWFEIRRQLGTVGHTK